jgi:hypothetical protein
MMIQSGVATKSVNEEVFGAVHISKENDAISTKTSHARSSLSETRIAFGGMETSIPCERLDKLKSTVVTWAVAPVARMSVRFVSAFKTTFAYKRQRQFETTDETIRVQKRRIFVSASKTTFACKVSAHQIWTAEQKTA